MNNKIIVVGVTKCTMCEKTWNDVTRADIVIHYRDDHQGNLMFLDTEGLKMMVDTDFGGDT